MAVASVWVVLNAIVLDTTGIHEGCRIKAAEEGILEYMLMECIPALSKGSYHREKVRHHFYLFILIYLFVFIIWTLN